MNLDGRGGAGGCGCLLLDGSNRGRADLGGRGRSGRGEDGAPVDLVPVDVVQVVGNGLPVDIITSRSLGIAIRVVSAGLVHLMRWIHLRLTPGVEAGVTVVVVGSGGLADSEGAQHQGRGEMHFDVVC